ncbi:MAG: transcription elongation factor GreB [Vicingaceae bacterium]|jgi:transcription elongation factor GreB
MSRGFVREDDQEELPMVPPRPYLPDGATNYVTPEGVEFLLKEKEELLEEKKNIEYTNDNERRIAKNLVNATLNLLVARIDSAKVVDPNAQKQDSVRFGANLKLKMDNSTSPKNFKIVGVDEADISQGKISYLSPVAKVLMEKKVGDKASLQLDSGQRIFEILEIDYAN